MNKLQYTCRHPNLTSRSLLMPQSRYVRQHFEPQRWNWPEREDQEDPGSASPQEHLTSASEWLRAMTARHQLAG